MLRVLLVSPAAFQAESGGAGGVSGYVGDLAASLPGSGAAVGVVSSGHVYQPRLLGRLVGACRFEELPEWGGIRRFQIVNSPVLAPSLWQFGGPEAEASCRAVERAFSAVCRCFRPDVVHVHGFEGLSAGIVNVARRRGIRVVVSVHNYHPFCPQVYLLLGRRTPCLDYEGGMACERCEGRIDLGRERLRRAQGGGEAPNIPAPARTPVMTFDSEGLPTAETLDLWRSGHRWWEPTEDGLPKATESQLVSGRYGARRRTFVNAMNACDAVVAVSQATAEVCHRMGVASEVTRVVRIGSWAAEVPASKRPEEPSKDGPLRLVFLGFGSYPKGLGVLCDAIGLLTVRYRQRIVLAAHGTGVESERPRIEQLRRSLAGVEIGGRFARSDVVSLLARASAAVVPSVWPDNGPQTAIEARALGVPVIGARIGGIPDIVSEGVDGLLFRANDRFDLARVIAGCIRESDRLAGLRRTVRRWQTMSEHAGDLVGLYREVLSSRKAFAGTERA